jgi:hypothetical protein
MLIHYKIVNKLDEAGIVIQPFVKESSKKNNPTEQLE